MSERGRYGSIAISGGGGGGSSWGTWILGGLVVGGAVLWAQHQSKQIAKLYATAGLPHHSFASDLSNRAKALAETARSKIHTLTAKKEEA